jgi:hypothetical protein
VIGAIFTRVCPLSSPETGSEFINEVIKKKKKKLEKYAATRNIAIAYLGVPQ